MHLSQYQIHYRGSTTTAVVRLMLRGKILIFPDATHPPLKVDLSSRDLWEKITPLLAL